MAVLPLMPGADVPVAVAHEEAEPGPAPRQLTISYGGRVSAGIYPAKSRRLSRTHGTLGGTQRESVFGAANNLQPFLVFHSLICSDYN